MQTQTQVAGPHGQPPQLVRGGFPLLKRGLSNWRKAWHNDDDASVRRQVLAHITKLVQKRGLENKMPEIAIDVEMALYLDAVSKEEYGDLNTLEHRICSLMLRLRNKQNSAQPAVQPHSLVSNNMVLPTPVCSNSTAVPPSSHTSFTTLGSGRFLPTHGGSRVLLDSGITATAAGYDLGSIGTGVVRTGFTGDGYVMNTTDLDGGSLYNPVIPTGLAVGNSNVNSLASAPSKMIPVPGIISEQQNFKLSQHFQPQHCFVSHCDGLVKNSTFSARPEQQQQQQLQFQMQQGRSLVVPNHCGSKDSVADLLKAQVQPPLRALPDRDNKEMLSGPKYESRTLSDQPPMLPHLQVEQAFQSQGNHNVSWMEKDHQNNLGKQFHLQSEPHNLQHCCHLDSTAEQHVEHSEQTCQANSADTGQSEVVSKDESLAPRQVNAVESSSYLQDVKRHQWLLILFRHVSRCTNSGKCTVAQCEVGRKSWKHVTTCRVYPCSYPRCMPLKRLLKHHNRCRDSACIICGPVRTLCLRQSMAARARTGKGQSAGTVREYSANEVESHPVKRVKLEDPGADAPQASLQHQQSMSTIESQEQTSFQDTLSTPKEEFVQSASVTKPFELQDSSRTGTSKVRSSSQSPTGSSLSAGSQPQGQTRPDIKSESDCMKEDSVIQAVSPANVQTNQETAKQVVVAPAATSLKVFPSTAKPAKMNFPGISYLEFFTPQQIRQHISSLRKWIGQSKSKAEKNQAMEHQMSASACSACAVEILCFDPIPVFCSQCGCRIKRNATYHTTGTGENSVNFCGPCYSAIRSDTLETYGCKVQKSMLGKKKNSEQRIEGWVECDKCKKWQHQICVLFNARINKERSEYVCPDCCIAEMERGTRVPRPASSVFGAKDLPRTVLSDHVEERLAWKLEQERLDRATALGKKPEEVLTAEGLVVRVVSSVDKKLDVKRNFLELFQQEDYPKEFVYKSKMLLLFQEIEGVEVCLFGMYVQEFGAENPQPNQRHVYLSYLDSVKYFRPDVKTVTGEALRTFVYHEILIAYLDYCKKRGFSSCYIWACPPLKGDDYILYCHPEIQKTPKTDKLREWYLSMIAKAKENNIVVAHKNLYDYFFMSNGECKAKVTAARLPYFDGDYWPGAAEDILQQLQQEKEGFHSQRRGTAKKVATKRSSKTSAQAELADNASRDLQLMHKLGQSIFAMKEDFIMVHLHNACTRCRNFITTGRRWVCQQCTSVFQLCSCCYEEHQKLGEDERHPAGKKECHLLIMEEENDVSSDTLDRDEMMESEFFDNRHAFLSLCQGNQYQYDTLRRAKHSSMMVLYHLHNPNAPAFITSCIICHTELETGQGWKCKICSDFDVCNSCISSQEVQKHPHKFVARPAPADQSAANKEARQQRMLQLRAMLELLVHASQCREASCQYGKCRNMKDLFRHGYSCTKRATGGCSLCKRVWFLLTSHAKSCKETKCTVPRCMDLREHARRLQLQQESRRRAAVNEMIRQRAAEAAGGNQ